MIFKILKNLIPYVFPIYSLVLGVGWIIFHAYIRLFMQKSSYTLEELKPFLTEKHLAGFIIFILIHIVVLLIAIYTIYKKLYPNQKGSFYTKISEKFAQLITLLYWRPLDYVYNLIVPHIPMSGEFFVYLESVWAKKSYIYFYVLIFFFEFLPKILIAFLFLIEIVVIGQIKLFPYSLSLILLVIFWHIFLKAFSNCGTINMPIIKEYFLTIKGVGDPTLDENGTPIAYASYEFILKSEYEDVVDVEESARLLLQFEAMPRFVEQIKKDTAKIMPYITLITSLIYIIGGGYRLIFFIT